VRNSSLGASQNKLVLYFYAASQSGGFEFRHIGGWTEFSAAGAQLYTGTEAAPTFVLGDYVLSDYNGGPNTYRLSISAVPEPEAAVLMLAGLGLVCGVAARRRQAVSQATATT